MANDYWSLQQIQATEQQGEYQVTWQCDYEELDHYEIRWGYRKEGESEDYYESVQNQNPTDGLQRSTYSPPTQYTLSHIFVDVKPVARQNDYWQGGHAWTQGYDRRWFGMADRQLPAIPDTPSISITNGNKLTVTINNIIQTGANSSRTNSIIFNIAKNGDTSYQTVEVPINNGTATYEMTVDYNAEYTVRAKGKNTVGESNYTNTWGGPERSAPIAISNFAIVPNVQDAGATVSLYMSWTANDYTDEYEVQYIDMRYDWSQEGSITSFTTINTTYTLTVQNGGEYKFRIRGTNSAGNGAWSELNVSFGLAPNYPTIWSDVTSTTNTGTINLYWKHNPKDSTREYKAEISVISDVFGPITIPIQDRTDQDEKDWYKNGSYALDLTQFNETTKLSWKVRTRGAKDEYSEWSPVKEITVYAKPYMSAWIQPALQGALDEPERAIDVVTEYPFAFCSRITEGHKPFDSSKMLFKPGNVDGSDGGLNFAVPGTNVVNVSTIFWENGYVDSNGAEQDSTKYSRTGILETPNTSIEFSLPIPTSNSSLVPKLDIVFYNNSKSYVSKKTLTNNSGTLTLKSVETISYPYFRLVYYYNGASTNVSSTDRSKVTYQYTQTEWHFVTNYVQAVVEDGAALQNVSTVLPSWASGRCVWYNEDGECLGASLYGLDSMASWVTAPEGTDSFVIDVKVSGSNEMTVTETAEYLSALKILRNYKHGFSQNITEYRVLVTTLAEHQVKTVYDTTETRKSGTVIYEKSYKPEDTISSGGITTTVTNFTIEDLLLVKGQQYKCTIEAYFESGLSETATKTFTFNPKPGNARVRATGRFVDDYLTFNLRPIYTADHDEYCLYVYRENPLDGTFTKIYGGYEYMAAAEIVDKHANFKMNNYVITIRSNKTATQASYHLQYTHHEPFPVIQWNERVDDSVPNPTGNLYKADQIRCIYNLDISESYKGTNERSQYAGRVLPTITYGKHITKSESWSFVIPEYDTETLTLLRRLSTLNEMVYIRTPDGDGYWAHVDVSINRTHMSVTTSVTLTIEKIWSDKP